jgi:hypothetical protein
LGVDGAKFLTIKQKVQMKTGKTFGKPTKPTGKKKVSKSASTAAGSAPVKSTSKAAAKATTVSKTSTRKTTVADIDREEKEKLDALDLTGKEVSMAWVKARFALINKPGITEYVESFRRTASKNTMKRWLADFEYLQSVDPRLADLDVGVLIAMSRSSGRITKQIRTKVTQLRGGALAEEGSEDYDDYVHNDAFALSMLDALEESKQPANTTPANLEIVEEKDEEESDLELADPSKGQATDADDDDSSHESETEADDAKDEDLPTPTSSIEAILDDALKKEGKGKTDL